MTKLLSSFFVAALLTSAGCQKSADLDRLQQETLIDVQALAAEVEVAEQRADALMKRGRQVARHPGVNEAGKRLTEARARIERLRALSQSAPSAVASAAATGFEGLKKATDELAAQLHDGLAHVRADLDAVDNWVASAQHAIERAAVPTPAPPEAAEADTGDDTGAATGAEAGETAPATAPATN